MNIRLIDYWASWCNPCRVMSPIVDELKEELSYTEFRKVNVDDEPELANEKKIMSIPTFVVEKEGKEVARKTGIMSKQELKDLINSVELSDGAQ